MAFRPRQSRRARTVVIPVPVTDARPAAERREQNAADREAARERRFRRRVVAAVLCAIFLGGLVTALFGDKGFVELQRLRATLADDRAARDEQLERVLALRAQVQRLRSDPMAKERIARERLGLARPGEVTFVLTEPEGVDQGEGAR